MERHPDPCLGPGPSRRPGLRGRNPHRPPHRTGPRRRAGERRRLRPIRAARLVVTPRRRGGIVVHRGTAHASRRRRCGRSRRRLERHRGLGLRQPHRRTPRPRWGRAPPHHRGHPRVAPGASWAPPVACPRRWSATFRTAQSWIGGTSPRNASFVPPPPGAVEDLMVDLVGFVNAEWGGSGHPGRSRPCPVRDHPPLRGRQRPDRADPDRLDPRPPHRDHGPSPRQRLHRPGPRRVSRPA